MEKKIAIQGVACSYHHIVSRNYFGEDISIKPCLTFDAVADELQNDSCKIAVMALENSIAGSIIPNYAIIDQNGFHVIGEYYLDIQHQFMVLPGQDMSQIKEVHSHPMALLQCKLFLKQFPDIKIVEAEDTALIAKKIRTHHIKGVAAIASQLAAETYDLKVLYKSVQTIKDNETRFVIVSKTPNDEKGTYNKASLKFELAHKRGSLATVLNVMSDCNVNLTKIQSMPKIESPWSYSFFVDVTFNALKDFTKAEQLLQLIAKEYKLLGIYTKARL
jgi:prephenate dehydratase